MPPTQATDEGPYLADLLDQLGGISPRRVLLDPPPGTATEDDLLAYERRTGRTCELVDGVLVEKPVGFNESCIAAELIRLMGNFVVEHDLGKISGEQGTMRLMPHLVRAPDVSFVHWDKFPGRKLPKERIPNLSPDLAVEVLSEGNTPGEIQRKLKEYFFTGCKVVWLVDPRKRVATVHTATDACVVRSEAEELDGGDILPGFRVSLRRLFEQLPAAPAKRRSRKK